jgi:hypothetical protein
MATIDLEGFDHFTVGDLSKKWSVSTATNMTMITGRTGGQALHQNGGGANPTKIFPGTYTEMYVGFAYRRGAVIASHVYVLRTAAGGNVLSFRQASDGAGGYYVEILNAAGSVVATGTRHLTLDTWYYIEIHVVVNGASGSVEVRVDGVSEIASTGGNFGSTAIGQCLLSAPAGSSGQVDWDDMYWCDTSGSARNTWLGDQVVETLRAVSDSATNAAWTSSSGTAHNDIDETIANGDTDYISDSTPGDRSTFVFGSLSISSGTINGVRVNHYARKDDAATRQIATVIRQGSTNYDGATLPAMSTTYAIVSAIYDKDPTGSDWTISTVNGDEFGVKEVA